MMKRTFLALLLLALSAPAFSQARASVDVAAGYGPAFRTLGDGGDDPGAQTILRYRENGESAGSAWHVGVHYNRQLTGRMHLRTGLRLTSSGYLTEITGLRYGSEYDGDGNFIPDPTLPHDFRTTAGYWFAELPVLARFQAGTGRWSPYVEAGLAPSVYLTTRSFTTTDLDQEGQTEFARYQGEYFRNFHLAGLFSVGCNYALSEVVQLFAQPTFRYHLTPIADGGINERLYSYGLEVGMRFTTDGLRPTEALR